MSGAFALKGWLFLILIGLSACVPVKNIWIRDDGSTRAEQMIFDSPDFEKYRNPDFYAYYNRFAEAPKDTAIKGWYF